MTIGAWAALAGTSEDQLGRAATVLVVANVIGVMVNTLWAKAGAVAEPARMGRPIRAVNAGLAGHGRRGRLRRHRYSARLWRRGFCLNSFLICLVNN